MLASHLRTLPWISLEGKRAGFKKIGRTFQGTKASQVAGEPPSARETRAVVVFLHRRHGAKGQGIAIAR